MSKIVTLTDIKKSDDHTKVLISKEKIKNIKVGMKKAIDDAQGYQVVAEENIKKIKMKEKECDILKRENNEKNVELEKLREHNEKLKREYEKKEREINKYIMEDQEDQEDLDVMIKSLTTKTVLDDKKRKELYDKYSLYFDYI
jgi:hypothetical protein